MTGTNTSDQGNTLPEPERKPARKKSKAQNQAQKTESPPTTPSEPTTAPVEPTPVPTEQAVTPQEEGIAQSDLVPVQPSSGTESVEELYTGFAEAHNAVKVAFRSFLQSAKSGGGKVQAVLGEFWTYSDASACSLAWSEANPDDLRLTREREVKVEEKK